MQNNKFDLRTIRTKNAIRDALVEAMEEKNFESITVKDITTRANINRSTFYDHYLDKYDLLATFQEEILSELINMVKGNLPNVIAEYERSTSLQAPFTTAVSIFEYINKNSRFMNVVLSSNGDLSFQTKLKEFMWKMLIENGSDALVNEKNLLVPADYLTSYVASAHLGIIQQWLDNGRKESPEEMAHILSTITVNGPYFAAGLKK